MKSHAADHLLRRYEGQALLLDQEGRSKFSDCRYPNEPRWRIDSRWIEFECGCRMQRKVKIVGAKAFDPIVFRGLPEQAVYDYVCHLHGPSMNTIVGLGGFATFDEWRQRRRPRLMES